MQAKLICMNLHILKAYTGSLKHRIKLSCQANKGRNQQFIIHNNIFSLKNVFTSYRMNHYSSFTSRVVISDIISAKLAAIHRLSWEYRADIFVISNTNLNRKRVTNAIIFEEIYLFELKLHFIIIQK